MDIVAKRCSETTDPKHRIEPLRQAEKLIQSTGVI